MVTWLDEEHRRDRAEISRLQQQIESQTGDIVEQARRIQELEGRLASTTAQLGRFTQLEQQIESVKQELGLMIDRSDEGQAQVARDFERARLADREALTREISEVRRDLPRIGRIEEAVELRKGEEERLVDMIMEGRNQVNLLVKDLEERTRQIPFLADQRTGDAKRIAQLQQETVELFKRTEAFSGRFSILEDADRRMNTEIERWRPVFAEVREEQQQFMERLRVEVVERLQVLTRWQEIIDDQRGVVAKNEERLQSFAQSIETARRAANSIPEFQENMRRDQVQVQELQRLAEERVRREMEEFEEEYEKKSRRDGLRQEHLWREQEKNNKELLDHLPPMLHDLRVHEEMLRLLWKLQEQYGGRYINAAQLWLDGLQTSLEERDETMKDLEEEWQKQRRTAELYARQNNTAPRTTGIATGEPTHNRT
jgi:DNA repair exonuclease SbcCD ATPase subunit